MEAMSGRSVEVEDLDPSALLVRLTDAEVRDRAVQLEKLQLAYQWCVMHPATDATGTATWGHAGLPGLTDCEESLGGDGTPPVAAFAAEPFGAALGVSTRSAMSLLADALDLRHRLPLLWGQVEALAVAPWKARKVAAETRSLPRDAAGWVDAELAGRVGGFGLPTIEWLVAHAVARHAPEQRAEKETAGKSGWHVTLTHPAPGAYAGTSWLEATGPTTDLSAFHDLLCAEARLLARLGDPDSHDQRKAKALGMIAARQATLDLTGAGDPTGDLTGGPTVGPDRRPSPQASVTATTLYLHLSVADLATHHATGDPGTAGAGPGDPVIGEADRLGPVTADLIRTWLRTRRRSSGRCST